MGVEAYRKPVHVSERAALHYNTQVIAHPNRAAAARLGECMPRNICFSSCRGSLVPHFDSEKNTNDLLISRFAVSSSSSHAAFWECKAITSPLDLNCASNCRAASLSCRNIP